MAALSVSGVATDRFAFEGYLPSRTKARTDLFKGLVGEQRTLVFYETPHRLIAALNDLGQVFGGERLLVVAREMTKQFETVLRGSLADLSDQVSRDPNQRKGEFVLVVAGSASDDDGDFAAALSLAGELVDQVGASQAARIGARLHGVSRRELYRALERSRDGAGEVESRPKPRES